MERDSDLVALALANVHDERLTLEGLVGRLAFDDAALKRLTAESLKRRPENELRIGRGRGVGRATLGVGRAIAGVGRARAADYHNEAKQD